MNKLNCECNSMEHKLLHDDLILINMFKLEENYTILNSYLTNEITHEMRSTLATWMLEICEEENLTNNVFYLSMNLFDRFMCALQSSCIQIEKSHLQLFGACCLFIASKLRSSEQLSVFKLVEYSDNSIRLEDLLELELFILEKLRWDVDSVTPNDYLEIFLHKLGLIKHKQLEAIKRHFYAFTALCSTELRFSFYQSSMLASSCLLAALEGLAGQIGLNYSEVQIKFVKLLNNLNQIETDCLASLREQVSQLLNKSTEQKEIEKEEYSLENIKFEDDFDLNLDYNLNLNELNFDDNLFESIHFDNLNLNIQQSQSDSLLSSSSTSLEFSDTSILSSKIRNNKKSNSKSKSLSCASSTSDLASSLDSSSCFLLQTPPLANSLPLPNF